MKQCFPRRRLLELALSSALITACGQLVGDTAQPASRSLPPCTIETWIGGLNATSEARFRDQLLPAFRARFPMITVKLAGMTPPSISPPRQFTRGGTMGSMSGLGGRTPIGGPSNGTRYGAVRGYRTFSGPSDTFNTVLTLAASGTPSDAMLAGTGNVAPVGLNDLSATVSKLTLRQLFGYDVNPASLDQVTFRGSYLGLPYLANPRVYIWKTGPMLNLTNGQLPTTWEEAIEAGTRAPSASARNRPPQRRPFAVTGLHIEFLNLIKSIGGTAIENGQAALAGPEGEEVARFLSDRGSTDLGSRLGTSSVWQPDIANPSTVGGWTTLRELQQARISSPDAFSSVRVGKPIVPGGTRYHLPGNSPVSRMTMATHSWWFVGRQSRVTDQAHALISYFIEPEPMLLIAETSALVPVRRSLIGRGFLAEPLFAEFARSYADAGAPMPILANAAEMEDALLTRLNAMVRGEMTPRRAVNEVAASWNETIARAGYAD